MAKFNTTATKAAVSSPITTTNTPSGANHQGGAGYARDTKGELFLLAVSNMVGENSFYENANQRDTRYAELVRAATVADPDWTARFLRWLRRDGNMRSASLVGAAEFVRARLDAGLAGLSRQVVDSVLQRADEPGEMLAYWTSVYGRALPKPIKRGVADAVVRLYDERSFLKWDSSSKGYRFGDVIDLTHPTPSASWQGALFEYAIDRRHNRGYAPDPDVLGTIASNVALREFAQTDPTRLLDAENLARAGMTWEDVLSLAGSKVDKARLWEALIPSMGYMALLRNLRNLDEAGVSDQIAERVAARLADPDQVAKSRQFPFRFYAAYSATKGSLRWAHALEKALRASLSSVPALAGRTLIVVDQSPSMFPGQWCSTANKSDISLADKAKLFGSAVALRAADATLVGYGFNHYPVHFRRGDAVLSVMDRFRMEDGTDTPRAVAENYRGHDRVLIITDEQTAMSRYGRVVDAVPANVPVYTWNLAGYQFGHAPSGDHNRHLFAGLTDAAFRMIPLLEAGRSQTWPF